MLDSEKSIMNVPSSVVNNLINKISSGLNWVVTHETAQRIAVKSFIDEIKNSDYMTLQKAALIYNAERIIKEYSNQENIVNKAMLLLTDTAKPEQIEDDWISLFMDKARLCSNEEFQLIWAKLLAEECNEPGNISKQLLFIVSLMEKEDARTFSAVCKFCLEFKTNNEIEYQPLIIDDVIESYYGKFGITRDSLRNLVALGLVLYEETPYVYFGSEANKVVTSVSYGDNTMALPYNYIEVAEGNVIFQKTGRELYKAINKDFVAGFWEDIAEPYLKKHLNR